MRAARSSFFTALFLSCAMSAAAAQTSAPQTSAPPASAPAPAPTPGPAQTSGPPAGYQLKDEFTVKSADGAFVIEQYYKDDPDFAWQFWVRHGGTFTLLDKHEDYPASFRFTNDNQWLVRTQKAGAGYSDLYLYKLGPAGFAPVTKKPISDLAWNYFYSRPESHKHPKPNLHISAGLVKGVVDNYKSLGEDWPANRYLVIGISGELDPTAHHGQTLEVTDWRVRYDLQTGKFDVPPDFAANNKKALIPKDLKDM